MCAGPVRLFSPLRGRKRNSLNLRTSRQSSRVWKLLFYFDFYFFFFAPAGERERERKTGNSSNPFCMHRPPGVTRWTETIFFFLLLFYFLTLNLIKGTGSGGQVNGGLSSIPSPTMPNFGMAPNSANGQNGPNGQDPASVYNGLAQGYPSRESPMTL